MKKAFVNGLLSGASILNFSTMVLLFLTASGVVSGEVLRERISINEGWRFYKYPSGMLTDRLIYDVRPEVTDRNDSKAADSKPTEALKQEASAGVLKPWILPSGNKFINNPADRHVRPEGNPGSDFPFVQNDFDDASWRKINLPHDWGVEGPFLAGWEAEVGGGMGRLASHGVAWYRKKLDIPMSDKGKFFMLEIDGAMSYAMVWLNGHLVGGWPYGYNSFHLDLTPWVVPGGDNQLAIRIDNPPSSSRWYPGGGIYRNVWLTKTNSVHVGQWGTFVTARTISKVKATISMEATIRNDSETPQVVEMHTRVFEYGADGKVGKKPVVAFPMLKAKIPAGEEINMPGSVVLGNPKLWGPPPTQKPHLYLAETTLMVDGTPVDRYETRFGIRSLEFHPEKGLLVNGEKIRIRGVNQHHDLGALGAAFNTRAAERQLEILREMGCNAIRMSHNPPAPELLELTDRMGFLVVNEIFDVWERKKTPLDFHLIFPDWYEADTRAFIRRDRNCPSVIMWSFGNEVGEQYTSQDGATVGKKLADIVREEDPTRPVTASMNYAKPDMPFPGIMDILSLNYQGEGIRDAPAYAGLQGIRTTPLYPAFHKQFPDKMIVSSETASTLSTRGTYLFPVTGETSAPTRDGEGADPDRMFVSAYELYSAPFGASPDKVFASQDRHPYVAGEFVWSGWDYLGEPTPYYLCRSSYSGVIDLAGFKKDRFYLYQSRWRPDLPMAHILPHWNWPERKGQITPVHVFTSGDEAELFLNGKSLGRKKKGEFEYRLRWDIVRYEPGELKVVAFKSGKRWAEQKIKTTDQPARLKVTADRRIIKADGKDLSFITLQITDKNGQVVPDAGHLVRFSLEGPGELVATDNGDPCDLTGFSSKDRKAYNGYLLAIVRSSSVKNGTITLSAHASGLAPAEVKIKCR